MVLSISPDDFKQEIKQLKSNKVRKVAKIRNRYNQVPHLTQGPNLTSLQLFTEAPNELATHLSDLYNLSITTTIYHPMGNQRQICVIFF